MIYRQMAFALIVLCACQSKSTETSDTNDSTAISPEEETDGPEGPSDYADSDEEKIVSFQEFHANYIATGKIKAIELPLEFQETEPLFATLDSPEGAFENIPKKNHHVQIYGLLPDTTRYYGIVYNFQEYDYIDPRPTGVYSTRVATFTKQGKFISRARIVSVDNFTGASSCGGAENSMVGYIDTDLSFFGIHLLTQMCGSMRISPLQLATTSNGMINQDGTITSKTTVTGDTGDEDEEQMKVKQHIDDTDFHDTWKRVSDGTMLTGGDLMNFFNMEELSQSDPYASYILYYPTGKYRIMAVVRRIRTGYPDEEPQDQRNRQYGFVVLRQPEGWGRYFSFNWKDSGAIESNEPSVSVIDDHFVVITIANEAGPTGKYVEEKNFILILSGDDGIDLVDPVDFSKEDLRIERNRIFAKRGMRFKSPDLNAYFSKFDWYKPARDNIPDSELDYRTRQVIDVLKGLEAR